MKRLLLEPRQLIAMADYPPLHSPEALRTYYEKYKTGSEVEPIIVVPVEIAIAFFSEKKERFEAYRDLLEDFLANHPQANYFMLGGKHRSAAATVSGSRIESLVVANDADVAEIHKLMSKSEITGVPSVGDSFRSSLDGLERHFAEHRQFWTMDEKTDLMIKNHDIPNDMLERSKELGIRRV